jgi:hypothetical protein
MSENPDGKQDKAGQDQPGQSRGENPTEPLRGAGPNPTQPLGNMPVSPRPEESLRTAKRRRAKRRKVSHRTGSLRTARANRLTASRRRGRPPMDSPSRPESLRAAPVRPGSLRPAGPALLRRLSGTEVPSDRRLAGHSARRTRHPPLLSGLRRHRDCADCGHYRHLRLRCDLGLRRRHHDSGRSRNVPPRCQGHSAQGVAASSPRTRPLGSR